MIAMNSFVPQLSTANQFSLVRVRSFKPAERVEIVRTYPKSSDQALYGSGDTGPTSSKEKHPDAPFVRVDIPFDTEEEGDALAKSIAMERMLNYITAEGSTPGDPRLKAGLVVTVSTGQTHYDGKYLITRVRHWFRRKSKHPYTTDFHAQRDATDQSAGGSQNQSANAPPKVDGQGKPRSTGAAPSPAVFPSPAALTQTRGFSYGNALHGGRGLARGPSASAAWAKTTSSTGKTFSRISQPAS